MDACDVVIQSSQIDYERPMSGRFTASSALADKSDWPAFLKTLFASPPGMARLAPP